ncbi:hypothetical protein PR001_g10769 [Phytophthora rubi]|uniref:Uncharacterized protein n=1 Tax=Phytophthora rubi TaxID=129364 RepID=A0A6A3MM58_9STRA|nr:hypothetical protein PR001_g10769 [Phytophthora rubi]KAE9043488.1 hypothetical protein PR002_g3310 [Phytophthora rubi]
MELRSTRLRSRTQTRVLLAISCLNSSHLSAAVAASKPSVCNFCINASSMWVVTAVTADAAYPGTGWTRAGHCIRMGSSGNRT